MYAREIYSYCNPDYIVQCRQNNIKEVFIIAEVITASLLVNGYIPLHRVCNAPFIAASGETLAV